MSGLSTMWNINGHVVHLQEVICFLNNKNRKIITMPALELKKKLSREITGIEKHRVSRADITTPIIVEVDRKSNKHVVVLDGNHRLTKAAMHNSDIKMRVLYSDERDLLFDELLLMVTH